MFQRIPVLLTVLLLIEGINAQEPPPPPKTVRAPTAGSVPTEAPLVFEFRELSLFASKDVAVVAIPESLRNLNGRRVQIRGFMCPPSQEHGNPGFLGVPEVEVESRVSRGSAHCAGSRPQRQIRYAIPVLLIEGTTIDWSSKRDRNPLLIEGTMRVEGSIDLEYSPFPFCIENAEYEEVERRPGHDWMWTLWGC